MNFIKANWLSILSFVVAIEMQIGAGSMSLAHMFPEAWIPYIQAWSANLATVGATLLGIYARGSKFVPHDSIAIEGSTALAVDKLDANGKIVPGSTITALANTAKVVGALLIAIMLSSLTIDPASAQFPKPKPLTGNIENDFGSKPNTATNPKPIDVWKSILTAALPDLVYASALAKSAGTLSGLKRKDCWDALISVNKAQNGTDLKDDAGNPITKPDKHFFTEVELLAQTLDNLSPTGPLMTNCAAAAQMAKMNVLQFINTAVTGAAGFAALGL